MWAFLDALCDQNYSSLIISGRPDPDEVQKAWDEILNAFSERTSSAEQKIYLSLLKEVGITRITLDQIASLVDVLKDYYAKPFADQLNKLLRVNFKFDPSKPEEYDDLLKRCCNRSKGILIDLQLKQMQLDSMQKKLVEKGTKPDRSYFNSIMITLSDHAGFSLSEEITVFEYTERLNRYIKYAEEVKKKK